MKHKVVVEFNREQYACLISAWASVVSPEIIEDFTLSDFVFHCALAGVPVVLDVFRGGIKDCET